MNSALYAGSVGHCRYQPCLHRFRYRIFLLALDLDELDSLDFGIWFKVGKRALLSFRPSDYLHCDAQLTRDHVWQQVAALGGEIHQGKVFFLGQVRCLGVYFSPVNFYYCHDIAGTLRYLLAEVSNTPWNERHYYLIDAEEQANCAKAFHVSPFMDLQMDYHWRFSALLEKLHLHIENHTPAGKLFDATLVLNKQPLNKTSLARNLAQIPAMTLKTVVTIYWQALKLYLKKVPYIPKTTQSQEMP